MPGTQPQGTHAFDPASSLSQLSMQILNSIDTEGEGAEDQVDPLLDSSIATVSGLVPPGLGTFSTSSIITSFLPPHSGTSSSSGCTNPPSSLSLPPTIYLQPTQQRDISMGLTQSMTTGSNASSTGQHQKRKFNARLASGMQSCSSKQSTTSKTNDLNPVVITTALNSTLNHMVDVMERMLDATAAAPPTPTISTASPPIVNSSIDSQPSSTSISPVEILDQVIRIISGTDSNLTEDQLLSASLFFTSASEDAIHAARTFVALSNNHMVQYHFLLSQLSTSSAKGKGRAVDDDFMVM